MAKDFKILQSIEKKANILKLNLEGEFDGNSAWELINLLGKSQSFSKIIVNTNKITEVQKFGIQTLINASFNISNKNIIIFEGQCSLSLKK